MGMGIGAGFGAAGAVNGLQQLLAQRQMMRAYQDAQNQQAVQNQDRQTALGLQSRQLDQTDRERQDSLAENVRQHNLMAGAKTNEDALKLGDQMPAGTFLPPDAPAVKPLQSIGLLKTQQERPNVDVGPLLPGDTGEARQQGFLKTASQKQQTTADEADAKVEAARLAAENRQHEDEQRAQDRLAQIKAGAAARPTPDKLTKVEHKGPDGKTIIEWLPQSELKGKTFDKGVSGAAETRLQSAQAVNQTGDDIIKKLSDPAVAAQVGPAMGRYNSVQEWIGNPPPELAELAGAIESYALANMGVHGMRSAQGAEQIKKLLNQKHTPESLIRTIKGLNGFSQHFMENEGRGQGASPAATSGKPTAEELIRKYGGS